MHNRRRVNGRNGDANLKGRFMTEDTKETETEEQSQNQTGEESQETGESQEQADAGSGGELAALREKVQGLESGISEERKKRQFIEWQFKELNNQQPSEDDETFITKAEAERIARQNWEKYQQEQAESSQRETFNQKIQEAQKEYKDVNLSEIMNDETLPVSPAMAEVLRASKNPAGLLVHLHKNREDAQKLYTMSPTAAANELGRIEAKLESPSSKSITSAPDPIETVGDRGSPSKDPDKMSLKEYEQWAKEQRGGSAWPKGRVGA